MIYYSTVTAKGQITLPVSMRKNLHLRTGQKVSITQARQGQLVVEAPPALDDVRAQLRANLKKQGFTPAKLRKMAENYKNGDGFAAYVEEKYGQER